VPDLPAEAVTRADYAEAVAIGGFPELALGPARARFRSAWCESYVSTVTAVANVEQVAILRRPDTLSVLLAQLAARSGGEFLPADLARDVGLDPASVRSYTDALSTLYLVRLLPAWTTSHTTRAKQRPVAHLVDTALATHLLGTDAVELRDLQSPWFGPLLESYVVGELAKQASWEERPVRLAHYRDRDQREIDVVLERGRDVVGVEVKATSTPLPAHAKHLAYVRDRIGARFKLGVVLHTGSQRLRLGDRIVAVPVSALWA
jgi:uncharacterized protein